MLSSHGRNLVPWGLSTMGIQADIHVQLLKDLKTHDMSDLKVGFQDYIFLSVIFTQLVGTRRNQYMLYFCFQLQLYSLLLTALWNFQNRYLELNLQGTTASHSEGKHPLHSDKSRWVQDLICN